MGSGDQTTQTWVIRQAGERRARLARERLGGHTDRVRGLGPGLPRGTLALHVPIVPIVPVPVPTIGGERGPDAVPAALGRGALVDRGDDGLCIGPVVRSQDKGCVRGRRGKLRRGRDERLEIGAFGWRRATGSVTANMARFGIGWFVSLYEVRKKDEISKTARSAPAPSDDRQNGRRTDGWIVEDDEKGGIVDPLDLEAAPLVFEFSKGSMDVPRLELGRETRQREDAGNAGGERHC